MNDLATPPAGGLGGGGHSGDPSLFRTYIVPPDATVDQLVEIAIEAHADSDGWAGQIRDDANHMVIVYNATAATISGIQFVFRRAPDNIGPIDPTPIDDPPPEPDTVPPPEPEPEPPPLPPVTRTGKVTAQALNVRTEPRVSTTTLLANIPYNTIVTILADENDYWYRIAWDAPGIDHAFVSKRFIKEIEP